MSDINWREVFARYVEIVVMNEGVDFLFEAEWSPEQWQEIQKLLNEKINPPDLGVNASEEINTSEHFG